MISGTCEDFQARINSEGALGYVTDWYESLASEMASDTYSAAEKQFLADPVLYYGRYLDPSTRSYFERTVIPVIAASIEALAGPEVETVLDLGCGLAMQSLILAALGKKVVAVDIRPESIELSLKRKRFYEERLGRELEIDFICGDFLGFESAGYADRIDGVFSMSAFSYVKPLEKTVSRLDELSSGSAKIILFEENSSNLISRIFRRRDVPTPRTVAEAFERVGFAVKSITGTCAIPKHAWRFDALNGLVMAVDRILRKSLLLAFSYKIELTRAEK